MKLHVLLNHEGYLLVYAQVTKGNAPETLIETAQAAEPPFTVSATCVLCRYPGYPHYHGGPPNEAASFACRDPGQDVSGAPAK